MVSIIGDREGGGASSVDTATIIRSKTIDSRTWHGVNPLAIVVPSALATAVASLQQDAISQRIVKVTNQTFLGGGKAIDLESRVFLATFACAPPLHKTDATSAVTSKDTLALLKYPAIAPRTIMAYGSCQTIGWRYSCCHVRAWEPLG